MSRSTPLIWIAGLFVAILAAPPSAAQSEGGTVTGRVQIPGGRPAVRARVEVAGSNLFATTDEQGAYRLSPVPSGSRTLTFTFVGFEVTSVEVEIVAGQTLRHDVTMQPFGEDVTVVGSPLLMGQAEALSQQKNALNITNVVSEELLNSFPDPNAAETTQRIPGITLLRDQGEGRYVQVRGTEARLNSTTINGERLPSPEAGTRDIALDTLPADLLQAIEVSKALTPDMDGDSIGGTVNLVTRRAPAETRISASLGVGYNEISEDGLARGRGIFGGRLGAEKKTGLLGSISASTTDRGSHNFEPAYDDGDLDELQLRHYSIERQRFGANLAFDQRISDKSDVRFNLVMTNYQDTEIRRAKEEKVGDDEIVRAIKDRLQESDIFSFIVSGNHLVSPKFLIDYRGGWNQAQEETPNGLDSEFLQEDVEYDPNVSPDQIDPDNIRANPLNEDIDEMFFDVMEAYNDKAVEEDLVLGTDFSFPFYKEGGSSGLWKAGVKFRAKSKDQNSDLFEGELDDDLPITDVLSSWSSPTPFFHGRYQIGPFQTPGSIRALAPDAEFERDLEEDLADFDSTEDTLAAYGMLDLQSGPTTSWLAGLRVESTSTDYTANELLFDEEGDPVSLTPVNGGQDYTELLPMIHLRKALSENTNLRAAITRTLSRPNFEDLAPFQLIVQEDREIERGNPDLAPTTSWNFDFMWERYLERAGILSAGVFYKELDDNIINGTFEEDRNGETFDVFQRFNGAGAHLLGLEGAVQKNWSSGFGIFFNVTLMDSEQKIQDRENTNLQGQPDEVGNLALIYEKNRFSGRIAFNYSGAYILALGEEAAEDLYVDEHAQLDFALRYQINDRWGLYTEIVNLTDEPYRVYEGVSNRPIQEEIYGWWGTIGVTWDM